MSSSIDTINAVGSANTIILTAAPALAFVGGSANTVYGGSGTATVVVQSTAGVLVAAGSGSLAVYGDSGSVTVAGGAGGGLFVGGTAGANVLVGGAGAATMMGGGGGDALFGGNGDMIVTGGGAENVALATADTLYAAANPGNIDMITGGGTADTGSFIGLGGGTASLGNLYGATVYGGAGAATVAGADLVVWGGAGSLVASLNGSGTFTGSTISGGNGSLTVYSGASSVMLSSVSDHDWLFGGTAGNNLLQVGWASTAIGGGNGDTIAIDAPGYVPRDLIVAGPGRETITDNGGAPGVVSATFGGFDTIFGGSGADSVTLSKPWEEFLGGTGSATVGMTPSTGGDTILGGTGRLTVLANDSQASLIVGGSAGDNLLISLQSADTLVGAGNGDQLVEEGSFDNNYMIAGAGNETLRAEGASGGHSIFVAGSGNALMSVSQQFGRVGDLFAFFNGHAGGTDTISGLGTGTIGLGGYGANAASAALAGQADIGGNANILLGDGTRIVVVGVAHLGPHAVVSF